MADNVNITLSFAEKDTLEGDLRNKIVCHIRALDKIFRTFLLFYNHMQTYLMLNVIT